MYTITLNVYLTLNYLCIKVYCFDLIFNMILLTCNNNRSKLTKLGKPLKKERLILKSTIWCQQSINLIYSIHLSSISLQSLKFNM